MFVSVLSICLRFCFAFRPRFGQKKNSSLVSLSTKQAEKEAEQKKKVLY